VLGAGALEEDMAMAVAMAMRQGFGMGSSGLCKGPRARLDLVLLLCSQRLMLWFLLQVAIPLSQDAIAFCRAERRKGMPECGVSPHHVSRKIYLIQPGHGTLQYCTAIDNIFESGRMFGFEMIDVSLSMYWLFQSGIKPLCWESDVLQALSSYPGRKC
jgi:hypothetical protein